MILRQTVNIQFKKKKNKLNFCNDLLVYEEHSSLLSDQQMNIDWFMYEEKEKYV